MALVICPECNAAVSEHADRCPTCGCSGDTIRKLLNERKQKLADYKKREEDAVRDRAEREWECYIAAISEAAEEYNQKYDEIKEKYKPAEERLISNLEKAENVVSKCDEKIKSLSEKQKGLSFFSIGQRNKYQKEIDEATNKCIKIKSEIDSIERELKSKEDAEIEEIAQKLKAVEAEQTERIEKEVDDLTVRNCKSAIDVAKTMIMNHWFMAFQVRDMLKISGLMMKSEIENNLAFADDELLGRYSVKDLNDVLDDEEFCERVGIGQKKVLDDYYYIALSDSAKDKNRQERARAYSARLAELEQRRVELMRQATLNAYAPASASQKDKPASVIARGAVGAIIAGPAGAIIGVGSALNKNMAGK